jgi:hypothetical protein
MHNFQCLFIIMQLGSKDRTFFCYTKVGYWKFFQANMCGFLTSFYLFCFTNFLLFNHYLLTVIFLTLCSIFLFHNSLFSLMPPPSLSDTLHHLLRIQYLFQNSNFLFQLLTVFSSSFMVCLHALQYKTGVLFRQYLQFSPQNYASFTNTYCFYKYSLFNLTLPNYNNTIILQKLTVFSSSFLV